ncbi:hypothetical protein [Phenylobacterium sp.]|jgi:hypothetical protein|uniref:hypothetical protein n=1 Tax=Phenylobacterium sp. TaxID=1871053 RepID=UPI002F928DF5
MPVEPLLAALILFGVSACVFALIRGGKDERIGAAVILANLVAALINELLGQAQIGTLLIDGITALILLGVAVRFASAWLGAVMLLYGLQFTLQAYYLVMDRARDVLSVRLNNLDFFLVCLCVAVATALTEIKRRKVAAGRPGADHPT